MSTWWQPLAAVSQALLTPSIALIGAFLAWQQWRINKLKIRLERYDKRLRVYQEVVKILSIIARDAGASTDDLLKFITETSEADFLFGSEIRNYIDEIYRRGLHLWRYNTEYRDYTQEKPEGYDHAKIVDGMHAELEWLVEQIGPAKEKFRKYLDISKL